MAHGKFILRHCIIYVHLLTLAALRWILHKEGGITSPTNLTTKNNFNQVAQLFKCWDQKSLVYAHWFVCCRATWRPEKFNYQWREVDNVVHEKRIFVHAYICFMPFFKDLYLIKIYQHFESRILPTGLISLKMQPATFGINSFLIFFAFWFELIQKRTLYFNPISKPKPTVALSKVLRTFGTVFAIINPHYSSLVSCRITLMILFTNDFIQICFD